MDKSFFERCCRYMMDQPDLGFEHYKALAKQCREQGFPELASGFDDLAIGKNPNTVSYQTSPEY